METQGIKPDVPPSGDGCVECLESGGWWVHLRRCAECGHIGCCDTSPSQHARKHYGSTRHPIIRSFEPGENWFFSFLDQSMFAGPKLAEPEHHPLSQPVPGPEGKVPPNWQQLTN